MRAWFSAFVVTIVVLGSVLLAPAVADEGTIQDPDDSSSPIDISKVTQGHFSSLAEAGTWREVVAATTRADAWRRAIPADVLSAAGSA